MLAFYIKEWYFKKKYGTVSYSNTTETEFDKRFNKLLSKFNKKKKKDFVEFDKEETEELLENLKASGKAHFDEYENNEFAKRLNKAK